MEALLQTLGFILAHGFVGSKRGEQLGQHRAERHKPRAIAVVPGQNLRILIFEAHDPIAQIGPQAGRLNAIDHRGQIGMPRCLDQDVLRLPY